jgi:hypothetical protein
MANGHACPKPRKGDRNPREALTDHLDHYDLRAAGSTTDRLLEMPRGECTPRARLQIALESYGGVLVTELDDDMAFPRAA